MEQDQLLSYGLNPNSQVWTEGMPQWAAAYTIPDLMTMISGARNGGAASGCDNGGVPPRPGQYNEPYYGDSGKNKTTAGLLALLLGTLGIQYFYLGKVGGGFITIGLSLITCGAWGLLTFVQGILMLTMSQQEFDRKFVLNNSTFPLF